MRPAIEFQMESIPDSKNKRDLSRAKMKVLFLGGEFGRRTSTEAVAISKCTLRLRDVSQITECERALIQFAGILSRRAEHETLYEWSNVRRKGLMVEFDILWYDLLFFEARKDAYRVGPHRLAFLRFGATVDDLVVQHKIL